jgi:hypothetical protein
MYRISRPREPGIYELDILQGETIEAISFSNIGIDSFNILTDNNQLFIISITDEGKLAAAVIDMSNLDTQVGH